MKRFYAPSRRGLAIAASAAAIVAAMPAHAEERAQIVPVRIAATNLDDGLSQFIAQTRQQILYSPALLKGKRSARLNGRFTADQALAMLLRGSGLRHRRTPSGAFVLVPEETQDAPERPETAPVPPPVAQALPSEESDIVVTGSRLSGGGFSAPTPVSTFNAAQLANRSANKVSDALNQLPQLRGSTSASQVANTSASTGTNGQNLLNMRNLGASRTLILLDGNRLPITNNAGSTDTNILPQALIKRVDVVTGGASASYGSDAVAGVVNFILDTRFEGLKGNVNGGITTYGDNASINASLVYGRAFADDRGRVIASAEYYHEDAVGYSNQPNGRSWFDNPTGVYLNPVSGARPRLIVVPNLRAPTASTGGLITSGPLRGQQFGPNGVLLPFDGGTTPTGSSTGGGDGPRRLPQLTPRQSRINLFSHGEFDLSDDVTIFAEGLYSRANSYNVTFPNYSYLSSSQFTIFRGNAYLPAAVVSMFDANPTLQSFTVGRFSDDITPITNIAKTWIARASAGIKGHVGKWGFDTSFSYSHVDQQLDRVQIINRNLYAAADAVVNPANGQIVCRSNLAGLDPDCAPMNIFGNGSVSAAANDYVTGRNKGHSTLKQAAFNANVRGDLGEDFNLGAGPIKVALGVAYRRETSKLEVDPLSNTFVNCTGVRGCPAAMNTGTLYGGYLSYNPSPASGVVTATEGYVELGVPVLKDLQVGSFSLARRLDLTLAARATDYNLSGLTYSWKLGGNWQVNDDVRLRYTRSRDIRAPNTSELFSGGQTIASQFVLPGSSAVFPGSSYLVPVRIRMGIGNPNLEPEKSTTTTFGGVVKPSWLPGLQVSLDYYKIKIKDAIAQPNTLAIIDGCYTGNQAFCNLITLNNGATPITSTTQILPGSVGVTIRSTPSNIATISNSGLDFELAYQHGLGRGTLAASILGNYLLSASNSTFVAANSKIVGGLEETFSAPRWGASFSMEYSDNKYSLFVQERLISKGTRNPNFVEGIDIATNSVPMVAYTDIMASYKFGSFMGSQNVLYFGINNAFNRKPPNTLTIVSNSATVTNYSLYDVLGRRFTLGLRFKI
ncbi:TonB-dependent receptor [Sphingobium sp. AN641]|uniref:TonB-dependent receptor n=1 Tax=Sphingobium sp. AN641 TaxID=3133443 RepID=UPI0030C268FF